ncbi:MAG: ATPase, T2SS/T4P/T4SS family, partial [Clostridiales bacterium]
MINEIIQVARELNASDLHLTLNEPPCLRIDGQIGRLNQYPVLTAEVIEDYAQFLITASNLLYRAEINEYDFTYVTPDNNRQRVNIFRQKGARGIVLRILNSQIPSLESLHLPAIFQEIASLPRGLVLVTGPTGSGKTTTLAAMVDFINHNRHDHSLTIEDPLEYLHTGK